jgi:hypothetical protein
MESRPGVGAGGVAVVGGTIGGITSCLGLGSLDGSVPKMELSRISRMTEGVSAGDVGDIGESGMAASEGPGSKNPSPGAAGITSPGDQHWHVVLKQVPKVQLEPSP